MSVFRRLKFYMEVGYLVMNFKDQSVGKAVYTVSFYSFS